MSATSYQPLDLQVPIEIARRAGEILMKYYRTELQVDRKADHSPVTEADQEANDFIVRELQKWMPQIPVLAEESGKIPPMESRKEWNRFWLVDPMDGTKEFLKHNGEFTVNIALIHEGEPVLGVIFAPAMDLLYYAQKGQGAWVVREETPAIQIFSNNEPVSHPHVLMSRSHPAPQLETYLKSIPHGETTKLGSSLKFCYLAEGRADLYPRFNGTYEWDVAAGDCIYRNASAEGQNISPLTYNKPTLRNGPFVLGLQPRATGQPARVYWLTGLSGSGKTTIASRLYLELKSRGELVDYLDGDDIRRAFPEVGFSEKDRRIHNHHVAFAASRLEANGITVVVALMSPFRETRQFARSLCKNFVEVHVATSLEECERRDPKGLYQKARRGELPHFSGITSPYEVPENPEIRIDTSLESVDEAAEKLLHFHFN